MNRLVAFLGVRPGEGRSAALMTAHSFFMGLSTVFFETAASALFLAQFEKQSLPWVYMAAAVVSIATGAVYSIVKERLTFGRLMGGTLLFLLLTVCALRLSLAVSAAAGLVFASLVWYRVLSILTDLEYWAVASRLYDVRQAKRLFGLIGAGEVVARIGGAFSVPLFVDALGVPNLLWLSAAALALCLVFLVGVLPLIARRHDPSIADQPHQARSLPEQFREVIGDPYLRLVTGIAVLAVFGKYFVDFAFLEQMKARYSDAKHLAGFFGLFSGLTQGLSLLTRVFVSGPLLQRFGIRVGLLVLPLTHIVCTALIVLNALTGDGGGSALVFWLVIANQGVYKTLKHPIDNPSFKVLYQPLKSEKRLAAQISVETIFTPITIGIAGGIMLLMSTLIAYDPVRFSLVLLANFILWAFVARLGSRAYQGALSDVLRRRIVDDAPFTLNDATSVALLRAKLASASPTEIMFALHLLERAEYPRTTEALVEKLDHADAGVRRFALERLRALGAKQAVPEVRRRLAEESDPRTRAEALRALAGLDGEAALPEIEPHADDPSPSVRRAALSALLAAGRGEGFERALVRLQALAASSEPRERRLLAQIAQALPAGHSDDWIAPLLNDGEPSVRREALLAAARSASLRPRVIDHLGHPGYAGAAASALALGGPETVNALVERFTAGSKRSLGIAIARVLGSLGGEVALAALRLRLDHPDEAVRSQVLEALVRCRYQARAPEEQAAIDELLRAEAAHAALTLAARAGLPESLSACAPLRLALESEAQEARRRAFLLLAIRYHSAAILRARDNIASTSRDRRAYAAEVLDVTIEGRLRAVLLPLVEDQPPEQRLLALRPHFPQPERAVAEWLRMLLTRPEGQLRPWTRAWAARAAALLGEKALRGELHDLRASDPMVRQTALAALDTLSAVHDEWEGKPAMLLIEKVMILKGVQIFAQTSEEILTEIAAVVEELEKPADEVIFKKGDAGDSMYVIVLGQVRVYDGDHTINMLGDREIFGELALLDPEPRSASCATTRESRLFRLDAETFAQLMSGNIEIVRGVLHVLCERLRRVTAAPAARVPGS